MISARPEAPAHIIRVNADRRHHADYIVAVQCGMLLVLWSDPTKVPGMAFEKSKCDYLAGKWAKTKQLAALPAETAATTANFYVEGLLKQVNSTPLEIRVANLCFESCPSLRDMQADSFNAHLRGISEAFSPKIKDRAPQEVFQKNMAMNAALALNWARLSGSRLCLLPYESTGHVGAGQKLLDSVDAATAQTSANHMGTVDAWADQLALRTLYRWELSNRRQ